MKNLLVFILASLAMLNVSAQASSPGECWPRLKLTHTQPPVLKMEMQMRNPDDRVSAPLRSESSAQASYRRPAGAFYAHFMNDGGQWAIMQQDIMLVKPYCNYTYDVTAPGADDAAHLIWEDRSESYEGDSYTAYYRFEAAPSPSLYVDQLDINNPSYFQYPHYVSYDAVVPGLRHAWVLAAPNLQSAGFDEGMGPLLSSKTFCDGGRDGQVSTLFHAYTGPVPFGDNSYGEWFGKNGGHFDGIAQVFEKPEHPYLLDSVGILLGQMVCNSPVELTCKVYRIDEVPAYREDGYVELSQDSWELIATGRSMVTPFDDPSHLALFTLYDHDEDDPSLEFEVTPTIDDAIIVVFEGYNDPEADGLQDFTCYISADSHVDEGYGELAYIKTPIKDQDGNFTGQYVWKGLNNFFSTGEMMTGYSIFLVAQQPFLALRYIEDAGEYTFDYFGGEMRRQIGDQTVKGIEFLSWYPSADEGWTMTCNGGDLPDWLNIELVDGEEEGEFNHIVYAHVTAEPIHDGSYWSYSRTAVVRFEIPGAYLDYKFIQGDNYPCGHNDDGEVNIADLNRVIDLILSGMYDNCYDINSDGVINIADVNAVIDIILYN